jgi:hypothetical protein
MRCTGTQLRLSEIMLFLGDSDHDRRKHLMENKRGQYIYILGDGKVELTAPSTDSAGAQQCSKAKRNKLAP